MGVGMRDSRHRSSVLQQRGPYAAGPQCSLVRLGILLALLAILLLPAFGEGSPGTGNNAPQLRAIVAPVPTIGDHPDGLVRVTLDGSGSSSSNFDPLLFMWRDFGNNVIATSPTVRVVLSAIGDFNFKLTICDANKPSICAATLATVHVLHDETPPM